MHLNPGYVHPSFSSGFTKQTVRQLLKELSNDQLVSLAMSPNLSADNKRIMANYIINNLSDKRLGALTIAQLTSISEHTNSIALQQVATIAIGNLDHVDNAAVSPNTSLSTLHRSGDLQLIINVLNGDKHSTDPHKSIDSQISLPRNILNRFRENKRLDPSSSTANKLSGSHPQSRSHAAHHRRHPATQYSTPFLSDQNVDPSSSHSSRTTPSAPPIEHTSPSTQLAPLPTPSAPPIDSTLADTTPFPPQPTPSAPPLDSALADITQPSPQPTPSAPPLDSTLAGTTPFSPQPTPSAPPLDSALADTTQPSSLPTPSAPPLDHVLPIPSAPSLEATMTDDYHPFSENLSSDSAQKLTPLQKSLGIEPPIHHILPITEKPSTQFTRESLPFHLSQQNESLPLPSAPPLEVTIPTLIELNDLISTISQSRLVSTDEFNQSKRLTREQDTIKTYLEFPSIASEQKDITLPTIIKQLSTLSKVSTDTYSTSTTTPSMNASAKFIETVNSIILRPLIAAAADSIDVQRQLPDLISQLIHTISTHVSPQDNIRQQWSDFIDITSASINKDPVSSQSLKDQLQHTFKSTMKDMPLAFLFNNTFSDASERLPKVIETIHQLNTSAKLLPRTKTLDFLQVSESGLNTLLTHFTSPKGSGLAKHIHNMSKANSNITSHTYSILSKLNTAQSHFLLTQLIPLTREQQFTMMSALSSTSQNHLNTFVNSLTIMPKATLSSMMSTLKSMPIDHLDSVMTQLTSLPSDQFFAFMTSLHSKGVSQAHVINLFNSMGDIPSENLTAFMDILKHNTPDQLQTFLTHLIHGPHYLELILNLPLNTMTDILNLIKFDQQHSHQLMESLQVFSQSKLLIFINGLASMSQKSLHHLHTFIQGLSHFSPESLQRFMTALRQMSETQLQHFMTALTRMPTQRLQTFMNGLGTMNTQQLASFMNGLTQLSSAKMDMFLSTMASISDNPFTTFMSIFNTFSAEQTQSMMTLLSQLSDHHFESLMTLIKSLPSDKLQALLKGLQGLQQELSLLNKLGSQLSQQSLSVLKSFHLDMLFDQPELLSHVLDQLQSQKSNQSLQGAIHELTGIESAMGQLAAASEGAAKIDKEQKLVSQFINSSNLRGMLVANESSSKIFAMLFGKQFHADELTEVFGGLQAWQDYLETQKKEKKEKQKKSEDARKKQLGYHFKHTNQTLITDPEPIYN